MKYIKEFVGHFGKRDFFSIRDCRVFLKQKKISKAYFSYLIHYLLKKSVIKRIARGYYTFQDDPIVAGFAFSPFYYGLQEALSMHGLWEQETNPVIITTKKARTGLRQVLQGNVLVRRIGKKMFFGFNMMNHCGKWVPVSDIEKTFIDIVYFNEKIPAEAMLEIKKVLRRKVLDEYLAKTKPRLRERIKKILGGN